MPGRSGFDAASNPGRFVGRMDIIHACRNPRNVALDNGKDLSVLVERSAGKEKLFVHPKLMRLLTKDTYEFEPYGA